MITRREFLAFGTLLSLSLYIDAFSFISEDSFFVFPQGIASGDPKADSIILWTRVNPVVHRKLKKDLKLFISQERNFSRDVKSYTVPSENFSHINDFTVKVKINGLLPGKEYYYFFEYGGVKSILGRFRTFPSENISYISFAVVTCQHFADGYYTSYRYISEKDILFVLHLGDQIYEVSKFAKIPERKLKFPSGEYIALNLEDYRYLYRTYLSDRNYQLARAVHPFIYIWDDHEFANDYSFDYRKNCWNLSNHPFNKSIKDVLSLRKASIKAWYEYTPAEVYINLEDKNPLNWIRIYRDFKVGNFMHLICTDERSYRETQPCEKIFLSKGCKEQFKKQMLGKKQKPWFLKNLKQPFIWNIWANEVMFSKLKLFDRYYKLDTWDGYAGERSEILRFLSKNHLYNTIILSGDLHAAVISNVKEDFYNVASKNICAEFMTPALSSLNLSERRWWKKFSKGVNIIESIQKSQNPWIEYINHRIWGYSILELNKSEAKFTIYSVDKYRKDSPEIKKAKFSYVPSKRKIERLI